MEENKKDNEKIEMNNECKNKIDITIYRMKTQMMMKKKGQMMNQKNGSGATQSKKI